MWFDENPDINLLEKKKKHVDTIFNKIAIWGT